MSIIVLIGAEFNALVYPRAIKAKESEPYVVRNP